MKEDEPPHVFGSLHVSGLYNNSDFGKTFASDIHPKTHRTGPSRHSEDLLKVVCDTRKRSSQSFVRERPSRSTKREIGCGCRKTSTNYETNHENDCSIADKFDAGYKHSRIMPRHIIFEVSIVPLFQKTRRGYGASFFACQIEAPETTVHPLVGGAKILTQSD